MDRSRTLSPFDILRTRNVNEIRDARRTSVFLLGRRGGRLRRWSGHAETLQRVTLESLGSSVALQIGITTDVCRWAALAVRARGVLRGRVVRLRSSRAVQLLEIETLISINKVMGLWFTAYGNDNCSRNRIFTR